MRALALVAAVMFGCTSAPTAPAAAAPGCPATYERQSTDVSGKVASAVVLGLLRYTTVEDASHQLCMIHSERFIGEVGAAVRLTLIALPPHGIWTAPYLMFKDEYDALPALEQ